MSAFFIFWKDNIDVLIMTVGGVAFVIGSSVYAWEGITQPRNGNPGGAGQNRAGNPIPGPWLDVLCFGAIVCGIGGGIRMAAQAGHEDLAVLVVKFALILMAFGLLLIFFQDARMRQGTWAGDFSEEAEIQGHHLGFFRSRFTGFKVVIIGAVLVLAGMTEDTLHTLVVQAFK